MHNGGNFDSQAHEPVFATANLEALFGEAPEVIAAVLETFFLSMNQQFQLLQAAVAADSTQLQQEIAHRIKGAARMSGALAMGAAAERLELAARNAPTASSNSQSAYAVAAAALVLQWSRLLDDGAFRRARQAR